MPQNKRRKKGQSSDTSENKSTEYIEIEILTRLKELEQKFEDVCDSNTVKLLDKLERLESQLFDISLENDKLKEEVKYLRDERSVLVDEVKSLNDVVKVCRQNMNDLEQYTRRANIRIFGMTEKKNENNMELVRCVINLLTQKLGLKDLNTSKIDKVHRIGKPNNNYDRAIIVKFLTHSTAERVLQARRLLKGSHIVIKEDLTQTNATRLKKVNELECVETAWSHRGQL